MRVIDLAEDLRVSPGDLLALLRAMGIPVQSQDAPVHDEDVARVLARVERGRRAGKRMPRMPFSLLSKSLELRRGGAAGARPRMWYSKNRKLSRRKTR